MSRRGVIRPGALLQGASRERGKMIFKIFLTIPKKMLDGGTEKAYTDSRLNA